MEIYHQRNKGKESWFLFLNEKYLFIIFLFSSGVKLNIWTICDDLFLFVFYLIILLCSIILEQYWLLHRWRNQTNRVFFLFFVLYLFSYEIHTYLWCKFIYMQTKVTLQLATLFFFFFYSWLGLKKKVLTLYIYIHACAWIFFLFIVLYISGREHKLNEVNEFWKK